MTASTAYSSSVQFYEKVYQLHGELKQQEEEQYNLQAELNRLMPSTQQSNYYRNTGGPNGFSSVISAGNSPVPPAVSYLLNNGLGPNPTTAGSSTLPRKSSGTNGVDKIQEDERRKVRNDMILKKVQELESTAAVFAARSEKLRVMKTEYESMLSRYAAKKTSSASPMTRLNLLSTSTPNIVAVPPASSKPVAVSVGVNTEISGPVQPIPGRQFQNGLHLNGYEQQPQDQHFGPSMINKAAASKDLAYSQFMATGVAPPVLTTPTATSALGSAKRFQEVVSASQTLLDQEASKKPEAEKEDPKFRHNAYFDISTTSESEMTSKNGRGANGGGGRRFEPAIPVNLTSMDDSTTTAETTASNVQAPAPMKLIKSVRKLSVDLVSETSELLVLDGQDPFVALQTELAGAAAAGEAPKEEDASESMATSVGDSVMDSIQNRLEEDEVAEAPVQDTEESKEASDFFSGANKNKDAGLKIDTNFTGEKTEKQGKTAGEEAIETRSEVREKVGERTVDPRTVIGKFDAIEDEFDDKRGMETVPERKLANGNNNSALGKSTGPAPPIAKPKKFKIKTNFDSDSEEVSEAPVAKASGSQQSNLAKKEEDYDDDFDDFFDV